MLLAQPPELPRDDLTRDPFPRERRRELFERAFECPGVLAERVDERGRPVRRQVEPLRGRTLEEPAWKLLALDLDLGHRAATLDELHERRRGLRPIADHRDEHERRARIGGFEVPGEFADAVVGQRPRVRDQERPPLAEQRGRREVRRLAPLPEPAVHLDRLQVAEELERGLPQQELVLAPQQGHRRGPGVGRAHAADSTTSPSPPKVTVTVPTRSVRSTRAPDARIQSRTSGTGWP